MPAIRSAKNATLICARIAEGLTLREIATELGCTSGAISIWCAEDEEFAKQYARAKQAQADRFADELLEIADDGTNDWMLRNQGEETVVVADHEHIQRSRLRVDARKWLMSKMAPKKYGDRAQFEHSGPDGGPIEHRIDAPIKETREEWLARTLGTAAGAATGGDPGDVV